MDGAEAAIIEGADPRVGGYQLLKLARMHRRLETVNSILKMYTKEELNNFALQACIDYQLLLLLDIKKAGGKVRINKEFVLEHQDVLKWLRITEIKAQIFPEAFKAAEEKYKTSPELLGNLLTIMKNSESSEKRQQILNFLIAESARNDKLQLLKLYEQYGGDIKSIPYTDIEHIKKSGQGAVWGYLQSKGVEMRLFL